MDETNETSRAAEQKTPASRMVTAAAFCFFGAFLAGGMDLGPTPVAMLVVIGVVLLVPGLIGYAVNR